MPADHGLRPDDLQSGQYAWCQPIQPGKYQTVVASEGQSLRRFTSQHVELMTKRQDLCLQRRSRPEQSDQRQPNQAANISHQPRASPNSTSLASRIEFPTMTGGRNRSGGGAGNRPALPLLWRPHVRHRDLRCRLPTTLPADGNEDRYLMSETATFRTQTTQRFPRWSLPGDAPT